MKIVLLEQSIINSDTYLPHNSVQSICPKCNEIAYGDSRIRNSILNFGKSAIPSKIKFTCYNRFNGKDCDTEWEEEIILTLSVK